MNDYGKTKTVWEFADSGAKLRGMCVSTALLSRNRLIIEVVVVISAIGRRV